MVVRKENLSFDHSFDILALLGIECQTYPDDYLYEPGTALVAECDCKFLGIEERWIHNYFAPSE